MADGINTYTYVNGNPLSYTNPFGLETVVIINNNIPLVGTHAGVIVGSGSSAVLFDPGGSYRTKDKGSGDALYGKDVNPKHYINHQRKDGPNVQVYRFATTPAEEALVQARIENGSLGVGFCAFETSGAIKGIGPFRNLGTSFFPGSLERDLRELR